MNELKWVDENQFQIYEMEKKNTPKYLESQFMYANFTAEYSSINMLYTFRISLILILLFAQNIYCCFDFILIFLFVIQNDKTNQIGNSL